MKQTATGWLLSRLLKGHSVTVLQFFKATGCFHLPARIKELKKRGYAIESETVKVGKKKVTRYRLTTAAPCARI